MLYYYKVHYPPPHPSPLWQDMVPLILLTLLLSVCWCVNIRFGASSLLEPDLLWITSQMCIEGIQKHWRDSLHIKCMEQYSARIRADPAEKSITTLPWDDCKANETSVLMLLTSVLMLFRRAWTIQSDSIVQKKTPAIVKLYSIERIIILYAYCAVSGRVLNPPLWTLWNLDETKKLWGSIIKSLSFNRRYNSGRVIWFLQRFNLL